MFKIATRSSYSPSLALDFGEDDDFSQTILKELNLHSQQNYEVYKFSKEYFREKKNHLLPIDETSNAASLTPINESIFFSNLSSSVYIQDDREIDKALHYARASLILGSKARVSNEDHFTNPRDSSFVKKIMLNRLQDLKQKGSDQSVMQKSSAKENATCHDPGRSPSSFIHSNETSAIMSASFNEKLHDISQHNLSLYTELSKNNHSTGSKNQVFSNAGDIILGNIEAAQKDHKKGKEVTANFNRKLIVVNATPPLNSGFNSLNDIKEDVGDVDGDYSNGKLTKKGSAGNFSRFKYSKRSSIKSNPSRISQSTYSTLSSISWKREGRIMNAEQLDYCQDDENRITKYPLKTLMKNSASFERNEICESSPIEANYDHNHKESIDLEEDFSNLAISPSRNNSQSYNINLSPWYLDPSTSCAPDSAHNSLISPQINDIMINSSNYTSTPETILSSSGVIFQKDFVATNKSIDGTTEPSVKKGNKSPDQIFSSGTSFTSSLANFDPSVQSLENSKNGKKRLRSRINFKNMKVFSLSPLIHRKSKINLMKRELN